MEYVAKQAVNLPVVDFLEFELHLMETRPGVRPEVFLTELMRRWLATEMEQVASRKNGPALHGFQWKTLFLPDGTVLRTTHGDAIEFAKVCGDHIMSDDGAALTPSMFVNRAAKGRNAWRFVWLRFPGEDGWIRADNCRDRLASMPRKRSKSGAAMNKTV